MNSSKMSGCTNQERQNEEILALKAIYGEELEFNEETRQGCLTVQLSLPEEIILLLPQSHHESAENADYSNPSHLAQTPISIEFLPPISLQFQFSQNIKYPTDEPPQFHIDAFWLRKDWIQKLTKRMEEMYHEIKDVIIYNWAEFLANDALEYQVDSAGRKTFNPASTSSSDNKNTSQILQTINTIIEYDKHSRRLKFDNTSFSCGICLSNRKGYESYQFPGCQHVFCRKCLGEYFQSLIEDNRLKALGCPDFKCVKQQAHQQSSTTITADDATTDEGTIQGIPEQDIEMILGKDLYHRYTTLREKQELESRRDISWCPRQQCQAPVLPDPSSERLGICKKCGYTFCRVCCSVWHGDHQACSRRDIAKLLHDYIEGDGRTKYQLENRYGKRTLEKLVRDHQQEKASMDWIQQNTRECPSCHVVVNKIDGCNHMTCIQCRTHFCYLCGVFLDPAQPYRHYNHPYSSCYQRLFLGAETNAGRVDEDDDDDGVEIVFEEPTGEIDDDVDLDIAGLILQDEVPQEHVLWALGLREA